MLLKLKKRYHLDSSEMKRLMERLSNIIGKEAQKAIPNSKGLEAIDLSPTKKVFLLDGKLILIETEGQLLPALINEGLLDLMPSVIVDMGALPHVCNGADIMAPGIIGVEGEFAAEMPVVVRDERHHKAIAIGRSLFDSSQFRKKKHGRMVKNLHFVGDDFWKTVEQSR